MLISELMKLKPNIFQFDSSVLSQNKSIDANVASKFDDDEEENFKDVKNDSSSDELEEAKEKDLDESKEKNCSWLHKRNIIFKKHDKYNFQERNPLYCGADKTLTFELLAFTKHYHPTVVVFANKLMNVINII